MAKHCEVCKQDYPDSMASCPNCDAANLFQTLTTGSTPPPETPPAPVVGKPTMMAAGAKETMLAPATAPATQLAPAATPTQLAPAAAKTQLAPPDAGAMPMPSPEATIELPASPRPLTGGSMLAGGEGGSGGEAPVDPKKTMLGKPGPKSTVLAPTETAMEFPPGDEKKTMLARGAQPTMLARAPQTTQLAPPDAGAMPMPEGTDPKKTMLAPQPGATILAPGDGPMDLPPGEQKKTMLAPRPGATVLAPPDESGPMDLPAGSPKKTMMAPQRGSTVLAPEDELSSEVGADVSEGGGLAREMLEGEGAVEMGSAAAPGLADSSTKYETADDLLIRKPAVKAKSGRGILGGIAGLLIGAAACVGVLYFGLVPEEYLKEIGLAKAKTETAPGGLELARAYLAAGEFQKAIDTAGGDDLPSKAVRGEALFLQVLQTKEGKVTEADINDAMVLLTDAKGSDYRALLFLGYAKEAVKKNDEARKIFESGKTAFAPQKDIFQGALNQLDAKAPPAAPKDAGARAPLPLDVQLALMLVAVDAKDATPEAGVDFWKALAASRTKNYDDALKALAAAKKNHDTRRFANLRKPQNPTSDPTEEIFLRACDELESYWKLQKALKDNPDDPVLKAARDKGLIEKDGKTDDMIKALEVFAANKKAIEAITAALKNAKGEYNKETDTVKAVEGAIKDADIAVAVGEALKKAEPPADKDGTLAGVDMLIKEHKWITDALQEMVKEQYLTEAEARNRDKFPEGFAKVIDAGRSPLVRALTNTAKHLGYLNEDAVLGGLTHTDFAGRTLASEARSAELRTRLGMSRTPTDMLTFWLPLLEKRERKEVLEGAHLDAKRVLDDKTASAIVKANALCVEGLALRNEGKFDAARTALADALKVKPAPKEGIWRDYAIRANKELTDPTFYYLPMGEKLIANGELPEAVELLNAGVGAFPNDGRVIALRSVAALDLAVSQARGRLTAKDLEKQRADAAAAIKAGAASEGNYAAGRIAEELGRREDAERYYTAALEASRGNASAASRIRVALGRVLLQMAPPKALPKEGDKLPMPNKMGRLAPAAGEDQLAAMAAAALLSTAVAAAEDDLEVNQDALRALQLGDQAIRAGNPEGYLIKGTAQARMGQWTKGLKTYTEGLRRLIKPEYGQGLFYLVDHHPAFSMPDALRVPDPVQAEKHYANGLKMYFAGQYPQAEDEFLEAYRNNAADARYLYFLGLSRLSQQGRRNEAIDNFQQGWLLERQQKPNSAAVGNALERVQGPARQVLNSYRQ